MLKPFTHQTETTEFILNNARCLVTSDPGTGKTRSVLDAYQQRPEGRLLVFAPLSILQASWGDDIDKFTPGLSCAIAYARNREEAFLSDAQVVITNHDAVKWVVKRPELLEGFNTLCIDEFTAFKNKNSQRSKAMSKVSQLFDFRIAMSGTPNSNTILDIWHPTLLVDDGKRLGNRYYAFRSQVCTPVFNGFANEWRDKEDAQDVVATQLGDINIRYELEECIDMPPNSVQTLYVVLPPKVRAAYDLLAEDSVLYTKAGTINAVHAGARVKKLLQLCTGAVYDDRGEALGIHKERYALVIDLIASRKHSLVAFNWRHEREHLTKEADKLGIVYGILDGSISVKERTKTVREFQDGKLQTIFAHPQTAGHGLTLTKATTVIWCSPTYNAEQFEQFNRRIYRAGQTRKTQTILIAAKNTWEPSVFEKLQSKLDRMENLLDLLKILRSEAA